ncbi:MAG: alanine--tRNA ligase [Polyangiaceae bacterium]|nr:alanine--tRNA ligase [Polyangiaceae bacterium]
MKSAEIRKRFLDYFARNGHAVVPSSPLVPKGDPTLLFTNAGMVQFKGVFLGEEKREYTRATTCQRCMRAGGKHNDLENVGRTARHHTFFEMLGNFSFGDYFKDLAIELAWNLITKEYGLPADRLLVTVFSEDDQAASIWKKLTGFPDSKIIRIPTSDNFWAMGDTGPCGPCSEIFFDHGPGIAGGPPGSPDADGDRFIEIWNLVFMQFEQVTKDKRVNLPKPSIDTGMGLERIAAVLQGTHDNYNIDLFRAIIQAIAELTKVSPDGPQKASHRVIADHLRASAFLIADGVLPSNEGRGYVLRRIIRRAIRHGYKLGARAAFFHKMVPDLVAEMGEAYPELKTGQQRVTDILKQEEDRFFATIENGMAILEGELAAMAAAGSTVFNGETAFKLHDTFGFPLDLTADVCRERDVTVDSAAFDAAMARQKEQARAAGKFKMAANLEYDGPATTFHGYDTLEHKGNILALYKDGVAVNELVEGDMGVVVLDGDKLGAEALGEALGEARRGVIGVEVARDDFRAAIEELKELLGGLFVELDGERAFKIAEVLAYGDFAAGIKCNGGF